jgi:hypothetical protein
MIRGRSVVRLCRAWGAALAVAAMIAVPALVFAHPAQSPASPRLARGFEPPPSKVSPAPVAAAAGLVSVALPADQFPHVSVREATGDRPRSTRTARSTSRRGPPAPLV